MELTKVIINKKDAISQKMIAAGLDEKQITREISFATQLVQSSAQLQKCTAESVLKSIVNIANVGLTLNPAAKEAYLIPRWNGKLRANEATLSPGYIGLAKLIISTGSVTSINTQLVYENDQFSIDLAESLKPVTHKPELVNSKRGEIMGVYSLATMPDGTKQVEWMDVDDINEIRNYSEGYKAFKAGKTKSCIWESHYGEMARKTAIKRLYKYLPRANKQQHDNIQEAIQVDNEDYPATLNQLHYIDNLLQTANIAPNLADGIIEEMNSQQMSNARAKEIIEFLKANQLEVSPKYGQKMNQSQMDAAISEAVARENT